MKFDTEGMGKLKEVLGWGEDKIDAFKTICNEVKDLNNSSEGFAGTTENVGATKVRYIFKMEDIDNGKTTDSKSSESSESSEAASSQTK